MDSSLKRLRNAPPVPVKLVVCSLCVVHLLACGLGACTRGALSQVGRRHGLEQYVSDLYWAVMTMTTVGYGDIAPVGTGERAYAMLGMATSTLVFGSMLTLISHTTGTFFDDQTESRIKKVRNFLKRRQVTPWLINRVLNNIRIRLEDDNRLETEMVLLLSPTVQRELALELLANVVLVFPLFRDPQFGFIAELAQRHTWHQYLSGDMVVEEAQNITSMAFVVQGQLAKVAGLGGGGRSSPKQLTREVDLQQGAWFGEACLISCPTVLDFSICTSEDADLAFLSAADYHELCGKFPAHKARHDALVSALAKAKASMSCIAYTGPRPLRARVVSD